MGERLRKIAECFALGPCLLCIKPEMVGIAQHTFEEQHGLIQFFWIGLTCACQRLHKPEGAHVERALLARKSIDTGVRGIAVYETVADEATLAGAFEDRIYRADHAGIVWSHKENQRHYQKGSIQVFAPIELRKRATLFVPATRHDLLVNAIALLYPSRTIRGQSTFVRQPHAAIQCHPVHDFGEDKMLFTIAHLPESCVGTLPVFADPIQPAANPYPRIV